MAGLGEGVPGKVEPTIAGEELIGEDVSFKEVDEALELSWIFGTDVGSLADKVLRVAHTAHLAIHSLVSEARIDDDGTNYLTSGL